MREGGRRRRRGEKNRSPPEKRGERKMPRQIRPAQVQGQAKKERKKGGGGGKNGFFWPPPLFLLLYRYVYGRALLNSGGEDFFAKISWKGRM